MDVKQAHFCVLVLVYCLTSVHSAGPLCFACTGASHARYCDRAVRCSDHQSCHVRRIITPSGNIQFTSGCINKQICVGRERMSPMDPAGHVTCIDCCAGDMCNNKGCNDSGPPPGDHRGLYCFNCDYMDDPSRCEKVTICPLDEKCGVDSSPIGPEENKFSSGCRTQYNCSKSNPDIVVGRDLDKRSGHCSTCCSNDFCNLECALRRNVPVATTDVDTQSTLQPIEGRSCKELYLAGVKKDGVYNITIGDRTFEAMCDMTNGGWTILQRRVNGSEDFTRDWNDYVHGFGDVYGEHWLGLENIYDLTRDPVAVELDLLETSGRLLNYTYLYFTIEDESNYYKLHVADERSKEFQGTGCINSGGHVFSTYDKNKQSLHPECATEDHGGWWYNFCLYININGLYGAYQREDGMTAFWGGYLDLKETTMKIK